MNNVNNEVVTFVEVTGDYQYSVKKEFFTETPEPEKMDKVMLFTTTNLKKHLHCLTGPAIIGLKDQKKFYFVDGKKLDNDVGEKLTHDHKFNTKLESSVTE